MLSQIRPAIVSFALLSLIAGVVYPLLVTGIARVAFPDQTAGSIVTFDGKPIGSALIAQPFSDAKYFWPRPSAADYNGAGGAGSNLSPTNPAQQELIRQRTDAMRRAHPDQTGPVPIDLLTASGSGLDPHISPAAAEFQIARVARARGVTPEQIRTLVTRCTEPRMLGLLGEQRVNVLRINLLLDQAPLLDSTINEPAR